MAPRVIAGVDVCLWAPEPTGGIWILSGFNAVFVDLLRNKLEWQGRAWNKESSAWWVSDRCSEQALDYAQLLYRKFEQRDIEALFNPLPETERIRRARERGEVLEGPRPQTEAWAWRVLFLRPGAPPRLVKSAKKALALHYHPDRVPDGAARMVEVNQAAAILETAMRGRNQW